MKRSLCHRLSFAAILTALSIGTAICSYAKESQPATGPAAEAAALSADSSSGNGTQGEFLGEFDITAYCGCKKCSSGNSLTYSGTTPKASHTISADLSLFPLGSRLKINDTIYTVEDTGSGVNGNHLDIYFDSHEEALQYGRRTEKVYAVK